MDFIILGFVVFQLNSLEKIAHYSLVTHFWEAQTQISFYKRCGDVLSDKIGTSGIFFYGKMPMIFRRWVHESSEIISE